MKKLLFLWLFFSEITFCPGEGPAYIGLHLENSHENVQREETAQKVAKEKTWWDHARDKVNEFGRGVSEKLRNWKSQVSKAPESSGDQEEDAVQMDDTFEESIQQETERNHQDEIVRQEAAQKIDDQEAEKSEKSIDFPFNAQDVDTWDFSRLKDITIQDMQKLSANQIKNLLNKPDFLQELTDEQIQAINPEELSKALQNKLSKPLNFEFVKKLSWEQTRQLLGDHTGLRLKKLLTKFDVNFTSAALRYMKNKSADQKQKVDFKRNTAQEDAYLTTQLDKLPKDKRPADVATAVKYMQEGKDLWDVVKKENLWSPESKVLDKIFTEMGEVSKEQKEKFKKIFNGESAPDFNDPDFQDFMKAYQKIIIKIQWYFYKLSILEDGRAFQGGTITFKDSEGFLLNFLDNYARLLNPGYKNFWKSWGMKAYKRTSSHFKGQSDNNIGIDIDVPKDELGLPLNYPHLLFGQRKNGYVFMKCEPHGMGTVKEVLTHGMSFLATRGENDESKHTKDRIPADVKKRFWELYRGNKSLDMKKEIDTNGISKMLELLKTDPNNLEKFKKYLTQERASNPALRNYQESTLEFRRGGESVIDPK